MATDELAPLAEEITLSGKKKQTAWPEVWEANNGFAMVPSFDAEQFDYLYDLGQGGCALVVAVAHRETGEVIAIKLDPGAQANQTLENEAKLLVKLQHRCIATPLAIDYRPGSPILAFPLYVEGDLEQRLRRGSVPEVEARRYAQDMVAALCYIHGLGALLPRCFSMEAKQRPSAKDLDVLLNESTAGMVERTKDNLLPMAASITLSPNSAAQSIASEDYPLPIPSLAMTSPTDSASQSSQDYPLPMPSLAMTSPTDSASQSSQDDLLPMPSLVTMSPTDSASQSQDDLLLTMPPFTVSPIDSASQLATLEDDPLPATLPVTMAPVDSASRFSASEARRCRKLRLRAEQLRTKSRRARCALASKR